MAQADREGEASAGNRFEASGLASGRRFLRNRPRRRCRSATRIPSERRPTHAGSPEAEWCLAGGVSVAERHERRGKTRPGLRWGRARRKRAPRRSDRPLSCSQHWGDTPAEPRAWVDAHSRQRVGGSLALQICVRHRQTRCTHHDLVTLGMPGRTRDGREAQDHEGQDQGEC